MKRYAIRYTDEAIADLGDICDFLSDAISETVADRTRKSIMADIRLLKSMPERVPIYDHGSIKNSGLRMYLAAKRYQAFLTVDNDAHVVFIVHIFFAASDYDATLADIARE